VRILFLNQYFPPDPAPTGILLREVADALAEAGHEVVFASAGQDYRGGQGRGSRMRRELHGLWNIFRSALKAGRIDAVVSATSPPLLVFPAAVIAKIRGARHYHWLFDRYPELATALGEIRPGIAERAFSGAAGWAYRAATGVVALDQDMVDRLKPHGVQARIIPPWVFRSLLEARAAQLPGDAPPGGQEPVWLYSGNLGRAHEWKTLLDAQQIIESTGSPWRLVFQGGGPAWPAAREYAERLGLKRCEWRPYVPEAELPASLLAADVLVVTQKPETCGLLWPSKLALATSLPRPILWVGPVDRAIARDLAAIPGTGIFPPGAAKPVADWLVTSGSTPRTDVRDAAAVRAAGLRDWVALVEGGRPLRG
jgi:glycosyltransferase involved in cell wall biosynthesis